jgi:hypothetical protein
MRSQVSESYHRYVLFLKGRRMAAEVEACRTIVATNQIAALSTSIAAVVVVAFA